MKKTLAFFIGLPLLAYVQFFNFTGFCYSEMRYLSDLELTYAGIAFAASPPISAEDRQKAIKLENEPYPFCCRLTGEPGWIDAEWLFLNKLVGNYRYAVNGYIANPDKSDKTRPYYEVLSSVNACGKKAGYQTAIEIDAWTYETYTQGIRKYWQEKLK